MARGEKVMITKIIDQLGHEKYSMYLATIGKIGYIFFALNNALLFDECMCCWGKHHKRIGLAIKKNRTGLTSVVFCGYSGSKDIALGINTCTYDKGDVERRHIEATLWAIFREEVSPQVTVPTFRERKCVKSKPPLTKSQII